MGAHALHASHYGREIPSRAREVFLSKFLDQVDPDHVLPEEERQRRAGHARKAHFTKLAYLSARKRAKKKKA